MDSKDRLVEVALRLFSRHGVEAVGVQEIVNEASITKPSLYHHFGNKEGLVVAVIEKGFSKLFEKLDEAPHFDGDLPKYLENIADKWFEAVKLQADWFRLQLSLSFMPPENESARPIRPGVLKLQKRFENLFEQAANPYGNMRGKHQLLASSWLGCLNHWTAIQLGDWAPADVDLVKLGIRHYMYGIFT